MVLEILFQLLSKILNLYFAFSSLSSLQIPIPQLGQGLIDGLSLQQTCDKGFVYQNVTDLIKYRGYGVEVHHLRTKDDYRLEIHRIFKPNVPPTKNHPVYLVHGFLSSSYDWVQYDANNSLGFRLVNEGYDVWLANTRGNYYSSYNYKLSPTDPKFWEFPFDVTIEIDTPLTVNYILNQTGKDKLFYGGYSMGTATGFGAFGGELQNKVKAIAQLGPVTKLSNLKGLLGLLPPALPLWLLLHGPFLPKTPLNSILAAGGCYGIGQLLTSIILYFLAGDMIGTMNPKDWYSLFLANYPAGSSVMFINQFLQMRDSNRFQHYDYGQVANKLKYNQTSPPAYDISKIKVPTYLFWAYDDFLTGRKEALEISQTLGNCKGFYQTGTADNGHASLIFGNKTSWQFEKITQIFNTYDN